LRLNWHSKGRWKKTRSKPYLWSRNATVWSRSVSLLSKPKRGPNKRLSTVEGEKKRTKPRLLNRKKKMTMQR
jgi:hypothetical protein